MAKTRAQQTWDSFNKLNAGESGHTLDTLEEYRKHEPMIRAAERYARAVKKVAETTPKTEQEAARLRVEVNRARLLLLNYAAEIEV